MRYLLFSWRTWCDVSITYRCDDDRCKVKAGDVETESAEVAQVIVHQEVVGVLVLELSDDHPETRRYVDQDHVHESEESQALDRDGQFEHLLKIPADAVSLLDNL